MRWATKSPGDFNKFESNDLLTRKIYAEIQPKVEHSITGFGKILEPVVLALTQWAHLHMLPRMAAEKSLAEKEVL